MNRVTPLWAGAVLAGSSLSALAQQPPAPGSPPRPGGGTVVGSVKKVDPTRRTLTVAPLGKGAPDRTLAVPAEVPILRVAQAKSSDLKVGDSVSISGVPLVLRAEQVRIGDEPLRPPTPPRPSTAPPAAAPRPGQPSRPAPAPRRPAPPGNRVYARVTRLNPLVLQLPNGPTFEVRTHAGTRFTRLVKIGIGQIKPGEPVMAFGMPRPDGTVQARRVQIGLEAMPFVRR